MPDFPIVDSHVHLYDVKKLKYGWLAGVPKINRNFLVEDFDRCRGPVTVEKIVFAEVAVDPGFHLAEADFIQGIADREPRIAGMVAHLPVERGKAIEADLLKLKQHKTLRGIRRLIQTEMDPAFCIAPEFLEGVRLIGKHGLSFDICIKSFAMTYAIELARRCPDVSFILDHIGKPDIKNGLREPWWSQLRELAKLPNVVCKVSGVITEADHSHWTKEQVKPYVSHTIDCFGFDRVMYGSDWSVSELTHAYPDWVAILDEVLAGTSETERRKFYRDTAIRSYRLS